METFLKHALSNYRSHIVMFVLYFVIAVVAYTFMRQSTIDNFRNLGNEVASFYKMEEEKSFSYYKTLLNHLAKLIEKDTTSVDKKEKIENILSLLGSFTAIESFHPYVIMDGEVITGSAEEDSEKSVDLFWYDNRKNIKDQLIISDVYYDKFTKVPTITIARYLKNMKDAVAVDFSVASYVPPLKNTFLPSDSNYYLFGVSGNLYYYDDDLGQAGDGIRKNAKILYDIVTKKGVNREDALSFYDVNGKEKFIFFDRTKDNLVVVVTIPYAALLSNLDQLLYLTIAFLFVIGLTTFVNIWFTYNNNKKFLKIQETLTFLGNIYYAIILINTEKETYSIVKVPRWLMGNLENDNNYVQFLDVVKTKMEPDVAKSFEEAFSMENVHKLAQEGIKEFGGEFKSKIDEHDEWVSVRIFLDHVETMQSAIICLKEVTKEKEQEVRQYELLKSAVENAKKSEKSRNDFFARMSHDMRTPLNGIIGFTELGMNHAFTVEETKEYLNKIKLSSHQLLELINYILEISRIENGNTSDIKTKMNLREVIEHSVQPFHSLAMTETRNFSVHYDIRNEFIFAPAFKFVQIINNLLSNAFKYSKKGDSITVSVSQLYGSTNEFKQTKYLFVFEDTGIGMSKEFLERIFIPYQRETMFASKDIIGTGLGMAIVQSIVTGLNGEININSELGKGTKISIVIPFDVVDEEDVPVQENTSVETKDLDLMGLSVLLVEDNQINMEIATKLLMFKGMTVDKAYNGKEAVDHFLGADENKYDVILMDLQMPVMNGLEAAKAIRESSHPRAESIPIIAVSANTFAEDIAQSLQVGMNDHISKPLDVQTLYYTIYTHTRGKRKNYHS